MAKNGKNSPQIAAKLLGVEQKEKVFRDQDVMESQKVHQNLEFPDLDSTLTFIWLFGSVALQKLTKHAATMKQQLVQEHTLDWEVYVYICVTNDRLGRVTQRPTGRLGRVGSYPATILYV